MTIVEGELLGLLPQHTILTISVTATTTIGKPLAEEELKNCFDGCDMIIKLEEVPWCWLTRMILSHLSLVYCRPSASFSALLSHA